MNKTYKIAIEASNIVDCHLTGVPKYSMNLISHISANSEFAGQHKLYILLSASRWKKRDQVPLPGMTKNFYLKNILLNPSYDLIHYTGVFHNHSKRVPKIVTVHDIAVLKKENNIPNFTTQETIAHTKANMESIARHADVLIFASESTRQDFFNMFSFPPDKTHVVYEGTMPDTIINPDFVPDISGKYGVTHKQYFLFVGTLSIRKNVLNIVKAFNQANTDIDLVLVGNAGLGKEEIIREIQNGPKQKRIKWLGFVTDEDLKELYRHAAAFVFPTYYEGFGVPLIDAMFFEIPVLAGNKGAAPEITNGHATLVDPFSIDSISEGLINVLKTDRQQLVNARKHASTFTWKKCAEETIAIYKTVL